MSTFLIHLLVPVLMISVIGVFHLRDIWRWSWISWIGDLDYLGWMLHVKYGWPNVHRALFHNVWILFALLGYSAWTFRNYWNRGGRSFAEFARLAPQAILIPYFFLTHLVLDIFQGGISAFWPLSTRNFFWWFEIHVDTTKPIPSPTVFSEPGSAPAVVEVSKVYLFMDSEEFAFFLLYLTCMVFLWVYRRGGLMRRPRTSIPETAPTGP